MKSRNYGDMQSSTLRDQIVFGIHNKKGAGTTAKGGQSEFRRCNQNVQSERTEKQIKIFEKPSVTTEAPVSVDRVVRARAPRSKGERSSNAREAGSDYVMNCRRCSGKHRFRQCPAYEKVRLKGRGKKSFCKSVPICW